MRNVTIGSIRTLLVLLAVGLVASVGPAMAQKKGQKEAEKFRAQTADTRKAVEKARDELQVALDHYNALWEAKEKKLSSAYGKVAKSLDGSEKTVNSVSKTADGMKKQAEKFFASWQKEIDGYSSPSMQDKSRERLDKVQQRYEGMLQSMREAKELYDPFVLTFREQVMYLGRDLNSEALMDLKDENAELNASAEQLFAKVDEILTGEVESEQHVEEIIAEDEAEAEAEAEMEPDSDAESESE